MTSPSVVDVLEAQVEAMQRMDRQIVWLWRLSGFSVTGVVVLTLALALR
jgi:hypothetical protein